MKYNGTLWELVDKKELIESIYDEKKNYIEENLESFVNSLSQSQKNALKRWMDTDDDHPKIREVKDKIKLLLYNKRNIPLNNKLLKNDKNVVEEIKGECKKVKVVGNKKMIKKKKISRRNHE